MNNFVAPLYTCKVCGGHSLLVTHVWSVQSGLQTDNWQEWGTLQADHHWRYEFSEKIERDQEMEVEKGDFSDFEEDDSDSIPEDYEFFETAKTKADDEFFVNCEGCDRAIEFGWSMPDRRGLIWPSEFSDFDPHKCWPDPKYTDVWHQRGWARSGELSVMPPILHE